MSTGYQYYSFRRRLNENEARNLRSKPNFKTARLFMDVMLNYPDYDTIKKVL